MYNDDMPQVQLWIGNTTQVRDALCAHLRRWWCAHEQNDYCVSCTAIAEYRWPYVRWMVPEKNVYIRETIEDVLHDVQFAIDEGAKQVVVFEAADMFGITIANRLLKLLEEPPAGWFFFLLTERPDMILPTVRSRCYERRLIGKEHVPVQHPFIACFTELQDDMVPDFMRAWEMSPISAAETVEMLDMIMQVWRQKYMQAVVGDGNIKKTAAVIEVITAAYNDLPMSGGQVLFWRLLFIRMMQAHAR